MPTLPLQNLEAALRRHGLVRFLEHYAREFPESHLKDLIVDEMGPHREMTVRGKHILNFGSDSFLGLDQDERVKESLIRGVQRWGSHNGASRAFASVRANEEAEEKLAHWLGTDEVLIYPSVSLANFGALPGLVGRQDLLVLDEHAHNSMQEGAKIAGANGVRLETFSHCDPDDLRRLLVAAQPYRVAVVAIDGVYSMSGALPPLRALHEVCLKHNAVLYVDDAHATAVLGQYGRGTVQEALDGYDNTLVVGSLSKGFSCFGGFVGCPKGFKHLLKVRSSTFIFGGPVPPAYLEAISTVCDILHSDEYEEIHARLQSRRLRLTEGLTEMGLVVLGGQTPIVSVLVGDEEVTLKAGQFLFDQGFYVQSVTFPAVPYHAGVLRIQVNANHLATSVEGLLFAFQRLKDRFALPTTELETRLAA